MAAVCCKFDALFVVGGDWLYYEITDIDEHYSSVPVILKQKSSTYFLHKHHILKLPAFAAVNRQNLILVQNLQYIFLIIQNNRDFAYSKAHLRVFRWHSPVLFNSLVIPTAEWPFIQANYPVFAAGEVFGCIKSNPLIPKASGNGLRWQFHRKEIFLLRAAKYDLILVAKVHSIDGMVFSYFVISSRIKVNKSHCLLTPAEKNLLIL